MFKAGDKIRAKKAACELFSVPYPGPEREISSVSEDGIFVDYIGSLFNASDNDTPCSLISDSVELANSADEPLPIGLDAMQPVPVGANPPASKVAHVPKPDSPNNADKESILEEAVRITGGARRRDYGSAKTNHERIALFWKVWDICKLGSDKTISEALAVLRTEFETVTSDDSASAVAIKMILMKLARHANTPKRDNMVDTAGYAKCVAEIEGL